VEEYWEMVTTIANEVVGQIWRKEEKEWSVW